MTPLSLFLIACATVFLGSVESAFSALMRLSLRLMAERGGRDDRLGRYLDDPLQLFIPVRILIGLCTVLAGVLIARLSTVDDALSVATFFVSLVAFVVVCEHLLPMFVTRRGPEEVLDVLLLVFHPIARTMRPMTRLLIEISGARGDREAQGNGADTNTATKVPAAADEQGDEGAISEEEGRELLQSVVDFTETVVREVMTPRPDIVAIQAGCVPERSSRSVSRGAVLAHPGIQQQPRRHHWDRVREGPGRTAAWCRAVAHDVDAVGVHGAGEQAGV